MRKFVLGLAAATALAVSAGAQADEQIGLTLSSFGTFDATTSSGLAASESGGVVTLTNGGDGQGFAYAVYTLDTPVPVSWIKGLTVSVNQLSASSAYTANPMFVIDADGTGGINATTNPPSFFYGTDPADLGVDGVNDGDAIISSDFNTNATAQVGQGFKTYTAIGSGTVNVEGWYGNDEARDTFDFYLPWSGVLGQLPHGGVDSTDLVHELYFILGGSGSFANTSAELTNPVLTIPEPASLGLLAAGGLLMFRRRAAR